jgi:uncharacterized protein YbbC (DUF1343 family)
MSFIRAITAAVVLSIPLSLCAEEQTGGTADSPQSAGALTGIDVLEKHRFEQLAGRRIGLITNHTGRNRDGKSTVELLHGAKGLALVALFSPEHGFEGKLDVANIGDSQDARTGIKVHSLYGKTRRPTAAMLADIDTLVFDIQDVGVRFYNFDHGRGHARRSRAQKTFRRARPT